MKSLEVSHMSRSHTDVVASCPDTCPWNGGRSRRYGRPWPWPFSPSHSEPGWAYLPSYHTIQAAHRLNSTVSA